MIFWTKFTPKESLVKIGKKWTTYEFCIFQFSRYETSASRIKFVPNFKFQFKLTISFFEQICLTRYFPLKAEKVNITDDFSIFELVLLTNFSLNWQYWLFEPNLPKKDVSSLNQKKWTPPLNSAYSNQSTYQISV